MDRVITIQIPEAVFEALAQYAAKTNQSPEEVAGKTIASNFGKDADPFLKVIGLISTGKPGWSDDIDRHVGESVLHSE